MSVSTPPHPVLRQYYPSDEARQSFVTELFHAFAADYDRVGTVLSFGSEHRYRRQALEQAGLRPGMKLLDVATGTGLMARAGAAILGDPRRVIGLDPNGSMLREAKKTGTAALVQGRAEDLPFPDASFDVLSMGYALRHVTSLEVAFREYLRVLRPGGRVLLLEITSPRSRLVRGLIRGYLRHVVPLIVGLSKRSKPPRLLMSYYWDTIEACVPPETILRALQETGFTDVTRRTLGGLLSEYAGTKPAAEAISIG
ncbi:MAG TPA: class I SAM-dependent methyltransferase [Thermoanaerobaculia bacterium]|nr:class I SAM-dependent methyltransferase [Thermoanaerobaculia bacterium]